MLDDSNLLTVTDIKQFMYCARVIYYERCLPHVRPRTYKMDAGRDAHEEEQARAIRRTLHGYDVLKGERRFDVRMTDEALGLTGIVDEVVYAADGEVFPVDYKLARQASHHYKVQVTAYAILLESLEQVTVSRGYLYLIPLRKLVKIVITEALRMQVMETMAAIRLMVEQEMMPDPPQNRNYCSSCEFRRFCNDV